MNKYQLYQKLNQNEIKAGNHLQKRNIFTLPSFCCGIVGLLADSVDSTQAGGQDHTRRFASRASGRPLTNGR